MSKPLMFTHNRKSKDVAYAIVNKKTGKIIVEDSLIIFPTKAFAENWNKKATNFIKIPVQIFAVPQKKKNVAKKNVAKKKPGMKKPGKK